jgi:hypothetical protein
MDMNEIKIVALEKSLEHYEEQIKIADDFCKKLTIERNKIMDKIKTLKTNVIMSAVDGVYGNISFWDEITRMIRDENHEIRLNTSEDISGYLEFDKHLGLVARTGHVGVKGFNKYGGKKIVVMLGGGMFWILD